MKQTYFLKKKKKSLYLLLEVTGGSSFQGESLFVKLDKWSIHRALIVIELELGCWWHSNKKHRGGRQRPSIRPISLILRAALRASVGPQSASRFYYLNNVTK